MEGARDDAVRELQERVEYLEGRERDLLIAAEIGQQLLEKNTELDMANRKLVEENRAVRAQLEDSTSRRKSVYNEREEAASIVHSLEKEVKYLQEELARAQAEHKAKVLQMATQQEMLQAEVEELAAKEMELNVERERVTKEQEEMRRQREMREEMGDIAVLDSPLVKEMQERLEGQLQAAQAAAADLERKLQAASTRVAMLEGENEQMQDAIMEKDELMKAVNSLARANHVLQMEQKEYMMLLKQEQSTSAALMQKLEEKRSQQGKGEAGMSLVDEVDELAQLLRQQQEDAEQEEGECLGDELEDVEEVPPPPPPIQTRDVGVQCVYIPLELMQEEEESEPEPEPEKEPEPEPVAEPEQEIETDAVELISQVEGCNHEEELEGLRAGKAELEQQLEAMKRDKRVFVTTIKKLDSDCKHMSEELQQAKARINAMEERKSDDKAMEISVLEKVLEIRERLSYVQKTINSKKMQSVLQGDELEVITKALIESAIKDSKRLLEEQGEMKLYGKSKEWVCQTYEIVLHNAELFYRLNRSFNHLAVIKDKYNKLVLAHNALLTEREKEKSKKWWHFGRNNDAAAPAPAPASSPPAGTAAKSPPRGAQ
mmetsp:Transcript_1084/g.3899  ORF Transcript_1084/g.3899 Transcript_1084/m.3899 type:complete len:602 (-) Transcript_1084:48-1853(-)